MCSKWITAIESGNPIIKPDTKPQPPTSDFPMLSSETSSLVEQDVVNGPTAPVSELDFMLDTSESVFFDRSDPSLSAVDEAKRAKQAAEEARAAFIQKQQQAQQRAKQEFDRFVRWMQTIENAKSPADLDDFLMREMATHLQGGRSEFTPDRLIRAFETMERHGDAKGMLQLQKMDPDVAKALSQQQKKNRVPHRTPPPQKKR